MFDHASCKRRLTSLWPMKKADDTRPNPPISDNNCQQMKEK